MKADTPKTYRLVELRAENVKKLKAVAVKIDGTVFKITGRNEQGKSSVLDAVAMAIGGPAMFPDEPIRKGQDKAEIYLDFGDLKLTRRLWRKESGDIGQAIDLDFADGRRPRDRQTVLDALRGSSIADDPIMFSRLKPRERYELLRRLVPDFDFEASKKQRQELFDERTVVGRQRDQSLGAADSIVVPPDAPLSPVDVSELAAQLTEAINRNAVIDNRRAAREMAADEIDGLRDDIDTVAARLKQLHQLVAEKEEELAKAEPLPAKVDVDNLQQKIAGAERANAGARKRAEKLSKQSEAETLETKYESLTQRIAALDKAKTAAIESAKLPVPELTFGDDDVMLDGLPFDQASTARKIRVSTALLMALKPELRVLLVREGSLLDDDARAALEEDAKAHGFVVLMECVSENVGAGGVVIENGEVV